MRVLRRILGVAVASLCVATAVGLNGSGRRPYDTPRSRDVRRSGRLSYLQREVERRGIKSFLHERRRFETQTPISDMCLALVRPVAPEWLANLGNVCGYVWRGEEAGRDSSTLMRFQFDKECCHWPKDGASRSVGVCAPPPPSVNLISFDT